MKVWPFIISGNPYLENRPVVVPDFVKEAGAEREIIRAAGGFNTAEGEAIYFKGYREGLGIIDMVFRVTHATAQMAQLQGGAILTDKQGRAIRVIAGFAFKERSSAEFSQSQLDAAFSAVAVHFPRYWLEEVNWDSLPSTAFDLPAPEGATLRLVVKESPTLPKSEPPILSQIPPPIVVQKAYATERPGDPEDKKKLRSINTPESSPKDFQERVESLQTDNRKGLSAEYSGGVLLTAGIALVSFVNSRSFFGALMKIMGIAAVVFGGIIVVRSFVRR